METFIAESLIIAETLLQTWKFVAVLKSVSTMNDFEQMSRSRQCHEVIRFEWSAASVLFVLEKKSFE